MNLQKETDVLSKFKMLNQIAKPNGICVFGSTAAARLPFHELMQDYNIDLAIYNRSIEGLTIDTAEKYIIPCIELLKPRIILLYFGEEELQSGSKAIPALIESYRWLLYQLHTAIPDSKLTIISVNEEITGGKAFNQALRELAAEYGCAYADAPSGNFDNIYALHLLHTLHTFFFDRSLTMSEALQYFSIS
ncbi:MAG: SGNH/GDSL hydrolase family protein [Ruminococcus sp.]|nr:SGNH/GDSL hydrolase family protein [Ruminococcus sp.]